MRTSREDLHRHFRDLRGIELLSTGALSHAQEIRVTPRNSTEPRDLRERYFFETGDNITKDTWLQAKQFVASCYEFAKETVPEFFTIRSCERWW